MLLLDMTHSLQLAGMMQLSLRTIPLGSLNRHLISLCTPLHQQRRSCQSRAIKEVQSMDVTQQPRDLRLAMAERRRYQPILFVVRICLNLLFRSHRVNQPLSPLWHASSTESVSRRFQTPLIRWNTFVFIVHFLLHTIVVPHPSVRITLSLHPLLACMWIRQSSPPNLIPRSTGNRLLHFFYRLKWQNISSHQQD
jgi:hypothetical protein